MSSPPGYTVQIGSQIPLRPAPPIIPGVTLCLGRLGHQAALTGQTLLDPDVVDLFRVSASDEKAAWELFLAREDRAYSFTDCTSFTLMRRLDVPRAAALDGHFRLEGFETVP